MIKVFGLTLPFYFFSDKGVENYIWKYKISILISENKKKKNLFDCDVEKKVP